MKVLFLGRSDSGVLAHLRDLGEDVEVRDARVAPSNLAAPPDFIVSHGYRQIVTRDVLALVPNRAINLHISYLPWNRGADPNLWSFIDGTPKGVTIHYMDEGLDTGDIIAQRQVRFASDATLASAYAELQRALLDLFVDQWPIIRDGRCSRRRQPAGGSAHRLADRAAVAHLLIDGWDTPVAHLERQERLKA